jgi:hypothetical protein
LKIFTCRTRQYVREYDYLNNELRQPAYNYSNYSSTTTSYSATTRHPAARVLRQPCRAPRLFFSGCTHSTSTLPCAATTRHPATHALRKPRHAPRVLLHLAQARRRLLRFRRASGCLGTSRGLSRGSSRRSSSTTPPPPRIRVPRHVARLVMRIVARLVVDYFAYIARPGASTRRAAHRLSSTTSPTPRDRLPRLVTRLVAWLVAPLVVDYFAYAARPGASTRRAAHHTTHRRLLCAPRLCLATALALLQPCRAS